MESATLIIRGSTYSGELCSLCVTNILDALVSFTMLGYQRDQQDPKRFFVVRTVH